MLVAPAPIGLLIVLSEPGKRLVFTVVFFRPHAIRTIFMSVPLMVVIMLRVAAMQVLLPTSGRDAMGRMSDARQAAPPPAGTAFSERVPPDSRNA